MTGTANPAAAAIGAAISPTLSPTPPVECASTFGLTIAERSSGSPQRSIAVVRLAASASLKSVAGAGHQERRHLVVLDLTARVAVDEAFGLLQGKFFAVALLADEIDNSVHKE